MRFAAPAGKRGLGSIGMILLATATILAGLLLWREYLHRQASVASAVEINGLTQKVGEARAALESATGEAASLQAALDALHIREQSQADRITNLEAQREHLKAETDRLARQVIELQKAVAGEKKTAAEARHRALQLEARPRALQTQLNNAQGRIDQLEAQLDTQTGQLSALPPVGLWAGASSDASVFAVEDLYVEPDALPLPVKLCSSNGIFLDGWINRQEESTAIGHVSEWHQPVSALVKGEKVFILPGNSHESHR